MTDEVDEPMPQTMATTTHKTVASVVVALMNLAAAMLGISLELDYEVILGVVLAVSTIIQPFVTWAIRNYPRE